MLLKMSDLETERLRLREFRQTDLADVARWEGTPHAEKFLEFCFQSYREWGMGPWPVLLKESGTIVGNCGFCRISYDRTPGALEYCGEVNYYVASPYRGEGPPGGEALRDLPRGFQGPAVIVAIRTHPNTKMTGHLQAHIFQPHIFRFEPFKLLLHAQGRCGV